MFGDFWRVCCIPTKLTRTVQISSRNSVLVGGKESKEFGVTRDLKLDGRSVRFVLYKSSDTLDFM